MSKTDRQLLHQKVRQRISVMKTNTVFFCCLQCVVLHYIHLALYFVIELLLFLMY